MTYHERKSVIVAISSALMGFLYYFLAKDLIITEVANHPEFLKQWGIFLVGYIPVYIITHIVAIIVCHIVSKIAEAIENDGLVEDHEYELGDEYDKLVDLKASQVGSIVWSVIIIGGLISLIAMQPIETLFNVFYCGAVIATLVSEGAKMYYYRKGV